MSKEMESSHKKIFVRLLDGTVVYVPIAAEQAGENYEILPDNEYEGYSHDLFLYEFYPGDLVQVEAKILSDGQASEVATRVVKPGNWPDRKFLAFKFNAIIGELSIDLETAEFYREEIRRTMNINSKDGFLYPQLVEIAQKMSGLL